VGKYRRKSDIEAERWDGTGDGFAKVRAVGGKKVSVAHLGRLTVETTDGTRIADVGDYVAKNKDGELCVFKPDDFQERFEPNEE
jgi:hypothetical protein